MKTLLAGSEITQLSTFDAYFTAGVVVQIVEQNVLPVTAIAN